VSATARGGNITRAVIAALLLAGLSASVGPDRMAAAQGNAVALVLEVDGGSTPTVQPYTEVPAGTTIELAPGAKLVLLHYRTCRALGVTGGKVTVGEEGLVATGGSRTLDARRQCPRTVRLRTGGEAAGTVLRSAPVAAATLPARPAFVVVGARAGEYGAVRILRAGQIVREAPLDAPRFQWPADAAPLVAGTQYELRLIPKGAASAPVALRFVATDPAAETPVLLAVE